MADHRPGEGGPGFCRDFDGAGDEELVVAHEDRTLLRKAPAGKRPAAYFSFLMKLISPLRSRRAMRIMETSSALASRCRSSSRSCFETRVCFIFSQSISPLRTSVIGWPLISL